MRRAISLHRPWPDTFLRLGKRIENRDDLWAFERWTEGPDVVFQASKTFDTARMPIIQRACQQLGKPVLSGVEALYDPGVLSFVGSVLRAMPVEEAIALADAGNPFFVAQRPWLLGPYCMVIGNVRAFKKRIEWKGKQGWFFIPDEIVEEGLAA